MVRLLNSLMSAFAIIAVGKILSVAPVMANDIDMGDHIKPAIAQTGVVDHQKLLAEGFRGIIDGDEANTFVDGIKAKYERDHNQLDNLQQKSSLDDPIRHAAAEQIDMVVTGVSNRNSLYTKFNSDGEPIAHHQDYPRPTIKSLTSSLFDAFDTNPYPGTD